MKLPEYPANLAEAEVWFDFDGTLVDSASGIVHSLQEAFVQCGLQSPTITANTVVGPPLAEVIDLLAPKESFETRENIAAAFRSVYDSHGCEKTSPFPGFPCVLKELLARAMTLRILTNKRQRPLEQILSYLRWTDFFTGLHGSDETTRHGRVQTKLERASLIHAERDTGEKYLVGDGLEDLYAAERIGARFFLAGWGYGTARVLAERPDVVVLHEPADLLSQLQSVRLRR